MERSVNKREVFTYAKKKKKEDASGSANHTGAKGDRYYKINTNPYAHTVIANLSEEETHFPGQQPRQDPLEKFLGANTQALDVVNSSCWGPVRGNCWKWTA